MRGEEVMESGGRGAVMLPLFRERGRHARTPLGPPLDLPSPLPPSPCSRDSRPLAASPLSAPRNVNSRRFNSYEYFPRAWGRSRSGRKDARVRMRKRKEKKKKKDEAEEEM